MHRPSLNFALSASVLAAHQATMRDGQVADRITIGHAIFCRKGTGTHAKRRAKRYARTMGRNKTQARR